MEFHYVAKSRFNGRSTHPNVMTNIESVIDNFYLRRKILMFFFSDTELEKFVLLLLSFWVFSLRESRWELSRFKHRLTLCGEDGSEGE